MEVNVLGFFIFFCPCLIVKSYSNFQCIVSTCILYIELGVDARIPCAVFDDDHDSSSLLYTIVTD